MTDAELEYEPPLFDLTSKGRTPPQPPSPEDSAGRTFTACNKIGPRTAWTDPQDRTEAWRVPPPKCNRAAGHDGPCRHINRRSFGVEAEWS